MKDITVSFRAHIPYATSFLSDDSDTRMEIPVRVDSLYTEVIDSDGERALAIKNKLKDLTDITLHSTRRLPLERGDSIAVNALYNPHHESVVVTALHRLEGENWTPGTSVKSPAIAETYYPHRFRPDCK